MCLDHTQAGALIVLLVTSCIVVDGSSTTAGTDPPTTVPNRNGPAHQQASTDTTRIDNPPTATRAAAIISTDTTMGLAATTVLGNSPPTNGPGGSQNQQTNQKTTLTPEPETSAAATNHQPTGVKADATSSLVSATTKTTTISPLSAEITNAVNGQTSGQVVDVGGPSAGPVTLSRVATTMKPTSSQTAADQTGAAKVANNASTAAPTVCYEYRCQLGENCTAIANNLNATTECTSNSTTCYISYDLTNQTMELGCSSLKGPSASCLSDFDSTFARGRCEFCCTGARCNGRRSITITAEACAALQSASSRVAPNIWPFLAAAAATFGYTMM